MDCCVLLRAARFFFVAAAGLLLCLGTAWAQPAAADAPDSVASSALPAPVEAALARAQLPRETLAVWVADAQDRRQPPRLAYRAQAPMNPASVMKLVTTYAALDLLGPSFTWQTPVYADGAVQGGTLHGNLYLRGQGDPKLVAERLWLLLKRVQAQGIQRIAGDIVLDRTAFELPAQDPADFDNEPLRPYNAAPDALLLNYQAVAMSFIPDEAAGVARIAYDLPLAGVQRQTQVPLAPAGAPCGDWRAGLRAELADAQRTLFRGSYPAACGERVWPVAAADPQNFAAQAIAGLWRELGGKLDGSVRDGRVPAGLQPMFSASSPTLAEVVRDVNKFSNNVMAQQVFLTLALQKNGVATPEGARAVVRQWWQERLPDTALPQPDNGAGLSRSARISAQALGRMLQSAWRAPVMPELAASLPILGVDGTLRRNQASAAGRAHLKTGSLRDVVAIAGYVDAPSGRRWVLVALVNHPNAAAARQALERLVEWVHAQP